MTQILMAVRKHPSDEGGESEPVVVDTDQPGLVRLELDDGDVIELDSTELRSTLDDGALEAA